MNRLSYLFFSCFILIFSCTSEDQSIDRVMPDQVTLLKNFKESESISKLQKIKSTPEDFSFLLQSKKEAWDGYLGKGALRLGMYFSKVSKESLNWQVYQIKGKSNIKANIGKYSGTITFSEIFESQDTGSISMLGRFFLSEDPEGPHAGEFEGKVIAEINKVGSSLIKCHFVGNFTPYHSGDQEVVVWGTQPLPLSEFLYDETGAIKSEFHHYGWKSDDSDYKSLWWNN